MPFEPIDYNSFEYQERIKVNRMLSELYGNVDPLVSGAGNAFCIPRILPPSGTLASNGGLSSLVTPLNITTFPYQCYMFFAGARFTASFAGTTMTVTGVAEGNVVVGTVLYAPGLPAGTRVTALGTGTGNTGTYTVSNSATIASGPVTGSVLGNLPDGTTPASGLYYTVMSSTTAGTVYNNAYIPADGVDPIVPAAPTPFALTGAGAYTQVVSTSANSNIPLAALNIPGGLMGGNGQARISVLRNWLGNANVKSFRVQAAGQTIAAASDTTGGAITSDYTLWNQGSPIRNVMVGAGLGDGNGSSAYNQLSLDTTSDLLITLAGQLSNPSDWTLIGGASWSARSFT